SRQMIREQQPFIPDTLSPQPVVNPARWLEDSIRAGHIRYFEYSQFKIIKKIGRGGFGTVNYAEWKACDRDVALKSLNADDSQFDESSLKEFVNELRLLRDVDSHPNINRFFGVTQVPQDFIDLYDRCLKENPDDRPNIEEVVEILKNISTQENELSTSPLVIFDGELKESPFNSYQIFDQTDNVSIPQPSLTTQSSHTTYFTTRSSIVQSVHSIPASALLDEITDLYIEDITIGSDITKNNLERWLDNHKENLENVSHYLILNQDVQHWEVMVGEFFRRGIGFKIDRKESLVWFQKASDMDDAYGHYNVGCYYHEYGICGEALKYFELAAKKGLVGSAKYMLGIMLNNGYGTDKDIRGAFNLFKEAAECGHVPAQYWLAVFYSKGTGTEKNRILASNWFKKCVDNGGYEDAEKFL
ncbi:10581_t:CDS:2, partial [Acaulospora morrowiae]